MAAQLEASRAEGLVNIIGGCLRLEPEHYRWLWPRWPRGMPRAVVPKNSKAPLMRLSGLEPLHADPRTFPSSMWASGPTSRAQAKFRKLITAGDYNTALEVARDQVENGAQIIDINMDEGLLDSKQAMIDFLNLMAAELRHRAGSGDDRFLQMGDHRGRPEMRTGQGGRQLDLHEGGRGSLPRTGAGCAGPMAQRWS